jgi:hypothetical protein
LRLGQPVEPVEHRRTQGLKRREWELHLRLGAESPRDPETRCRVDRILEQRRLADAWLALQYEHATLPISDHVQQFVERRALVRSAKQHRCPPRSAIGPSHAN